MSEDLRYQLGHYAGVRRDATWLRTLTLSSQERFEWSIFNVQRDAWEWLNPLVIA